MDFRDYTYVQMIAQYKTFSRAADALYISQPSLSKFLQKLEEELGTPLFKRVNKQMYPTYAGERFLETGQSIFALQNRLDRTSARSPAMRPGRSASPSPPPVDIMYYQEFSRSLKNNTRIFTLISKNEMSQELNRH